MTIWILMVALNQELKFLDFKYGQNLRILSLRIMNLQMNWSDEVDEVDEVDEADEADKWD